ncbi:MAG TPA: phosphotransferase family protein, partial [Blastocatellia bacterium]
MIDETAPVRAAHRFDETQLAGYLRERLEGFDGAMEVRQFSGGQSNPTFLLSTHERRCVLRKKPPGKLLPSAHQVEREYRIMTALARTDVPVCHTLLLCEDASIIGTPFFLMDYVEGRVFRDLLLPEQTREERAAIYDAMNDVLARLHRVDYQSLGLADFGRPGNYYSRQLSRWTKQYKLAQTEEIEAMNRLIAWLPANIPMDDETTVVHGDYRLENMIFHPTEPRILAVLDWELSTLGHPLADLAYNCMTYYINYGSTPCLRDTDF